MLNLGTVSGKLGREGIGDNSWSSASSTRPWCIVQSPVACRRNAADSSRPASRSGITKSFVMQMMFEELEQKMRQILDLGE